MLTIALDVNLEAYLFLLKFEPKNSRQKCIYMKLIYVQGAG
jgi:hypothetical protein